MGEVSHGHLSQQQFRCLCRRRRRSRHALGGDDIIYVIPTNDSTPFNADFDYFEGGDIYGNLATTRSTAAMPISATSCMAIPVTTRIYANAREDWCYGGSGNDSIWTGTGEDFVDAGSDDYKIYATEATNGDILHGGDGYD